MNQFDLNILKTTRKNILELLNQCTYEQVCKIPEGFSNSILWNFCHTAIVQQLLTYGLAGKEMLIEKEIIDLFRKGQSGQETISEEVYNDLKAQFLSFADHLNDDYEDLAKREFKIYPTSYNITLHNIDEAISFNNTHEALHFGIMMSQKKLV